MEKPKRAARTKKTTPAITTSSVVNAFGGTPAIFVEEIEHVPTPAPKKKTALKKPVVVAVVTPDGIQGSLTGDTQRPLIAHLPIHSSDIDNELFASAPIQQGVGGAAPTPYDPNDIFASYIQEITVIPTPEKLREEPQAATARPSLPMQYSEKLMIRFQDANRDQKLPESTDVACFWDCHTVKGSPFVIPVAIEEDIWRVYGNFCCPECAAAYLFNERLDANVQWERYALLNRLYSDNETSVRMAPPRSTLRLFGGSLDISEFRGMIAEKRMRIDVMTPPMISIIQVMDTKPIDFYDASMKNTFIPWEMDRMNRPGAQGLRLRRTKPIAEKESTLEYCMGIQSSIAVA
jgi:hypothetical protein